MNNNNNDLSIIIKKMNINNDNYLLNILYINNINNNIELFLIIIK